MSSRVQLTDRGSASNLSARWKTSILRLATLMSLLASSFMASQGHAKPAVIEPNVRWFTSYEFEHAEEDRAFGPFTAAIFPEIDRHSASIAVRATVPLGERFGARARLGTSYIRSEFDKTFTLPVCWGRDFPYRF